MQSLMDALRNAQTTFTAFPWAWIVLHMFVGACLASCAGLVVARWPALMMDGWIRDSAELLHEKGVTIPEALLNPSKPDGLWFPGSRCDHCHTTLAWWHNVPVFSWLILRGKCGFCQHPIPVSAWLAEVTGAALGGGLAWTLGVTPWVWVWMVGITLLSIAVWIDWQTGWLPDDLVWPLLWLGLVATLLPEAHRVGHLPELHHALEGVITGFGMLWALNAFSKLVFRKDGMGGGDLKLFAAIGAWTGPVWVFNGLLLAGFLGLVFHLLHRRRTHHHEHHGFVPGGAPFGPSLALGVVLAWALAQTGWWDLWPLRLGS